MLDDNLRNILVLMSLRSIPSSVFFTMLTLLLLSAARKTSERSCDLPRLAWLMNEGLIKPLLLLLLLRLNNKVLLDQLGWLLRLTINVTINQDIDINITVIPWTAMI